MFLGAIFAQRGHRMPKSRMQKLRALFSLAADQRQIPMQDALGHSLRRLLENKNQKVRSISRQTMAALGSSSCSSVRKALRTSQTQAQLHVTQIAIWSTSFGTIRPALVYVQRPLRVVRFTNCGPGNRVLAIRRYFGSFPIPPADP